MKKYLALYTPINPSRPYVGRLRKLHEANVRQNDSALFDYYSEEVLLPHHFQKHGLWRGQNVIHHFNQFYERVKDDYLYIGKWDDDIILPPNIIFECLETLAADSTFKPRDDKIGVGLFQEDYGAPNILMSDPLELPSSWPPLNDEKKEEIRSLLGGEWRKPEGWYGAFSRFYIYRMDVWGLIPVETPWLRGGSPSIEGEHSGDPDNAFQIGLKGNKRILDVPSIHLDHRALAGNNEAYRVLLDIVAFFGLR